MVFHEDGRAGSPAEGLDAEGSAPRKEIEHSGLRDEIPEGGEDGGPDTVHGRPRSLAGRVEGEPSR